MARMGIIPRILGLFLVLVVMIVGGLFWFDTLGIINAGSLFNPINALFGTKVEPLDIEDPKLLDLERIKKQESALELHFQDLEIKKSDIEKQNKELDEKIAQVAEREKALNDQEESLNLAKKAAEDYDKNVEQNSIYLTSMKPDDAVKILIGYEDQFLIDVMRKTEALAQALGKKSLVAVWLSKMDAKRASEIQRKMAIKPNVEQ